MQLGLMVLWAMATAPPGRAPLRLQFDKCPDIDRATVSRVVTMELHAELADERRAGAVTTATAQCGDGRVRLTIDDPVTGKTTTRTLELEGQDRKLRSRLLGLAMSEAVLASWIELQLTPEPGNAQPDAVASPDTRREAAFIAERRLQLMPPASPPPSWEIIAGPGVRWFSSGLLTFGLAGGARRWLDKHPAAGFGLDADGSFGEHSVPGVARATATSLAFAPSLLMRSAFGPLAITAGAGWRVGFARLTAEPEGMRPGGAAWAAWTGPFLAAELSMPLAGSLHLRASMEIGHVLVPADGRMGREVRVIELDGSWLGGLLLLETTL